jgi:hypothetical protein
MPKGKRRGAAFCDDGCKQAAYRSKTAVLMSRIAKLSVTKPPIYAPFSHVCPQDGVTGHPLPLFAPYAKSALSQNLEKTSQEETAL